MRSWVQDSLGACVAYQSKRKTPIILFYQFSQVSSGFGEKTRQLTHGFQILEAETRQWPSPTSGRSVLGPDRMGWLGGSGIDCCWTPLVLVIAKTKQNMLKPLKGKKKKKNWRINKKLCLHNIEIWVTF